MSEQRDNSGILARSEDKQKPGANPNWPDYKGNCMVNGVEYWLSGWAKQGKRGPFMSLSFKAKEPRQDTAAPQAPADSGQSQADMPF